MKRPWGAPGLARAISVVALFGIAGCSDSGAAPVRKPPPAAATDSSFVTRSVVEGGVAYRYQVFLPRGFRASARRWPVIVALHGSEERGADGALPTHVGLGAVVRARADSFPAVVVFPQIPLGRRSAELGEAIAMRALDASMQEFGGDPDRVYLTGLSLGGTLALDLVVRHPDRFAAFAPIAAGICRRCLADLTESPAALYPAIADRLRAQPTWIFHGERDLNVATTDSRHLFAALQAVNAPVRYSEYAGAGHDVWDRVYQSPEFLEWLLAQRRRR